ncbi:MAG: DUF354 domain-containing protein [Methanomassiliicoccus sp.]|nr:DUF354 domain-containing protein [Methanomassiliicoccus sp.]
MFKPRFQTESLHPVEHRYEERENSEVIEIKEPEAIGSIAKHDGQTLWIDIINPSDVHFFRPILSRLKGYEHLVTLRNRAETIGLAHLEGITGQTVGSDGHHTLGKWLFMGIRTMNLIGRRLDFDVNLSFENGMSVLVSGLKKKKSINFCDNDLKFYQKRSFIQDMESKYKGMATFTVVPQACYNNFARAFPRSAVIGYDGFKEDIYLSDYIPDSRILRRIPYDEYVVVRPESLGSYYVNGRTSIVPDLIRMLKKIGQNVVYLPRDKGDVLYAQGLEVFIPPTPFFGLDLCYFANAVLTGSGTLAREAACMGRPSVSFFPGKRLLSVDQQLVDEGQIFHSRSLPEISHFIDEHAHKPAWDFEFARSRRVRRDVMNILTNLIES